MLNRVALITGVGPGLGAAFPIGLRFPLPRFVTNRESRCGWWRASARSLVSSERKGSRLGGTWLRSGCLQLGFDHLAKRQHSSTDTGFDGAERLVKVLGDLCLGH